MSLLSRTTLLLARSNRSPFQGGRGNSPGRFSARNLPGAAPSCCSTLTSVTATWLRRCLSFPNCLSSPYYCASFSSNTIWLVPEPGNWPYAEVQGTRRQFATLLKTSNFRKTCQRLRAASFSCGATGCSAALSHGPLAPQAHRLEPNITRGVVGHILLVGLSICCYCLLVGLPQQDPS